MKPVSKINPLKHYLWGDQCDGWNLLDEKGLSVKLERMPPHTAEQRHYHLQAQQFFFMLHGEAIFEIEEELVKVPENHGIRIEPGKKHRILNKTDQDIEFLLSSQPSTTLDRVNC
jgi:mannose-6-phosphate isomerase-like protein (cupin superfamily)